MNEAVVNDAKKKSVGTDGLGQGLAPQEQSRLFGRAQVEEKIQDLSLQIHGGGKDGRSNLVRIRRRGRGECQRKEKKKGKARKSRNSAHPRTLPFPAAGSSATFRR